MVLILLLTPISGCFGGDDSRVDAGDLRVDVESMSAGFFQNLELTASSKMSVYLPFLIKEPASGFVQNSTVVDIDSGDTMAIEVLIPLVPMESTYLLENLEEGIGQFERRMSLGLHGMLEGATRARMV